MDDLPTTHQAAAWSATQRGQGHRIGFVPTMGALHEGHLDLVRQALEAADRVVCSIFVNPLQFNDPADLQAYPRQLNSDRELLAEAGCHALFAPRQEDLFADHRPGTYDLGGSERFWEGPLRPGHFQGVVNVVERLFHFVRPDMAFFGEKDRQQLTIIRHVATQLRWPEKIVGCPTVRAPDGLALSSRNARLSPEERKRAATLYRALLAMKASAFQAPVQRTLDAAMQVLDGQTGIRTEYLGIAHPETLFPLEDWNGTDRAVGLVAAQVGPVRLIDNITLYR